MAESKAQSISKTLARNDLRVQFDNRWRQELGIGNVLDPKEVAAGLLRQYQSEDAVIKLEEIGMPFARVSTLEISDKEPGSASSTEVERAVRDMERDLEALAGDARLKDIDVELKAWGIALRRIVADGTRAAEHSLDPRQRSRAFAARRSLGEYARLARYVGALTPGTNEAFRQLAQTLDVISSLILVLMGEALAVVGARSGQFLLQAPASELQERRDAVVLALRNLTGSVNESYDSDTWPRGLEGYRQLVKHLDQSGYSDLRILLHEDALAQQLNDLVDLSSGGKPDGLRGLGATAHMVLQRLRRLVQIGYHLVQPESPPLASLFSAITLFVDAFGNGTGGSRLLFVARPPILYYGHYGIGGPTQAVQRLQSLIIYRGQLAERLDCFMDCDCKPSQIRCQVILDKILYDVDRAIDLYAMGADEEDFGSPEQGAAAYAAVIQAFLGRYGWGCAKPCFGPNDPIENLLLHILETLEWDLTTLSSFSNPMGALSQWVRRMHAELCGQLHAEKAWEGLVHRLAPGCRQDYVFPSSGSSVVTKVLDNDSCFCPGALQIVRSLATDLPPNCPNVVVSIPPHDHTAWQILTEDVAPNGDGRPYL